MKKIENKIDKKKRKREKVKRDWEKTNFELRNLDEI